MAAVVADEVIEFGGCSGPHGDGDGRSGKGRKILISSEKWNACSYKATTGHANDKEGFNFAGGS